MSQLPSQPNSSQLSFPAQPLQPIGQGMDSAVLSLTHSPAPRSLTIDSGPQVCLPNVCVVCCIAEETWTRFLIWWFGEFGLITKLKNSPIEHSRLWLQIIKFKFCQYQWRTIFAKFNARQNYPLLRYREHSTPDSMYFIHFALYACARDIKNLLCSSFVG